MSGSAVTVIGAINRTDLSAVLSSVHRSGFGHVTRVLDPRRGDVLGQLRRAGVEIPAGFSLSDDRVVVMISAAARARAASELLQRWGAAATWISARSGPPMPAPFAALGTRPQGGQSAATESPAD